MLIAAFFVPLFGVLLGHWPVGDRDVFAAPAVRPAQILAWLVGFAVYQWLSPVGPSWWTSIVAHTHPGQGALGGSLPSFAASFLVALLVAPAHRLRGRAAPRRDRTSIA
jgi:hypothetical protein